MLFEQTIKCFKQYDSSKGCKRHPEQVSRVHYQGSQGVDTPSDLRGDRVHTNTTSVREHHASTDAPQSTDVRGHTEHLREHSAGFREANSTSDRANPIHHPGTTSSASLLITRESTMDSAVSERHITNGRDHLSVQSDLCWQDQPIQVKLGGSNSGALGHPDSNRGLSHPPSFHSLPTFSSLQPPSVHRGHCNIGGGDKVPPSEAGHQSNPNSNRGVLLQHVHSAQEGWGSETRHQPETPKQICEIRAFQNGGATHSQSSSEEKRLDGQSRPERCLFHGPNSPTILPFTPLQDGEKDVSIQLSSLWSLHSPRVFTKILKPSVEMLRSLGIRMVIYMDDMLLMASSKQKLLEHVQVSTFLLENLGFIINSKKSILRPSQEIEFLGMMVNSVSMDLKLPGEKIKKIRQEVHRLLSIKQPSAQLLSQLLGKLNATTPALQMAPLFCRSLQICLKQALSDSQQNYQTVVQLSTQALEDLQWWELHLTSWNGRSLIIQELSMTITSDASLLAWGATSNGVQTSGPWSPAEQSLHINCLELLAATLAIQTYAKEKSGISILLRLDNSTAVAYINRKGGGGGGGDSVTNAVTTYKGPVAVVHEEEHPPSSSAPTRSSEYDRGQGVQIMVRQVRVEAISNLIPENQPATGTTVHRPVCKQAIITAPSVCELETRPSSSGHRCVYSGLELTSRETVCQSTLGPDRQSPVTCILPRSSRAGTSSTSLESSSMVPNAPPNAGQSASSYTTVNRHNTARVSEQSTRHHPTASRVGYIRQQCESSHLSQSATDVVLSSWRDKSTKSYNSSFGKWPRWCGERNRNPFLDPISDVANFLAELYEQGYQYSSLNSYRSAISSTHEKVDGQPVGQHPTIVRVLKGAYNKRPPLPKYTSTWEVSKVTSYIVALGDNDSLSLKSLSLKLVVLLALTRPSRSNDLSNLSLKAMRVLPDGIQFNPVCLSKQSRPSRPLKPFTFPSFSSDKRLCPKEAMQAYVARTESFRGEGKEKLLLSFIKPHNPISSSSVARWIVTLLKLAGVDTDTFKSHSVRRASATAAASAGITTNQIMEAADWRSESVFERFYYKPGNSNQVGQAVLSTSSTDSLQTSR